MLTIRASLKPNGHVQLPASVQFEKSMPVLVTFLDEVESQPPFTAMTEKGSVSATLALLHSPEFRTLPKADPAEIEQRIQALRNDWGDDE